jgi:Mn2+/Fe2+ NRAMP family transporter
MAVSGIGASDVISATVGGATYGTALLWALVLGAFFKFVLTEGLSRWQLATGTTLVEGWARHLPRWVLVTFFGYLILWSTAVGSALISGCGLAIENITGGAISYTWGALSQAIIAFIFIRFVRTEDFGLIIHSLITIMFIGIVACAALTFREPAAVLQGLFVPTIPAKGGAYVLSLIGGIGGSLTLLNCNYLLRPEQWSGPRNLHHIRVDLGMAYLFTAIFGLCVMLIANRVFYAAGIPITDSEAVSRMAGQVAQVTGPVGFYVYSIGFWAAVLASLIGVWQTVPRIFADCSRLLLQRSPVERQNAMHTSSRPDRTALAFMVLVSMPFAFVHRPLLLVVTFTVIGSLFIPFLSATLLYLNNRVPWPQAIPHNKTATNTVLILVLLLFLLVAAFEIPRLF